MKIEFRSFDSDMAIDVADYKVEDNKVILYLNSIENEPFHYFQLEIDGSFISFNYDARLKIATITFDDKKHIDFIMGIIKMNNMKNKIGKIFKF